MRNTSNPFLKKKIKGNILQLGKTTGPITVGNIRNEYISWVLLYTDNGDTQYVISIDNTNIEFTPLQVDSIPLRASDFQGIIPMVPMVVYTDGIIYIVALRVGVFANQFEISINPPSGVTINYAWEVIINEQ